MKANMAESAMILGVSVPTLRNYVAQGMPIESKGGRGVDYVLNLPKCVEWLGELRVKQAIGDTSLADEKQLRLRVLKAQTTIAEIQAAKEKGDVVLKEDARRLFTNEAVAVKVAFLSIPGKVSAVLAGITDQRKIREVLGDEINNSLAEFTNRTVDVIQLTSESDEPDNKRKVGAATKPRAKRVGRAKSKDPVRKRAPRKTKVPQRAASSRTPKQNK